MPLVLSAISICLCVIFFFYFRRYIARRTSSDKLLADYRSEVYRLIAEIDAAADRDSRLVEDRVKTLRQLLEDTDKRISVYMRELERSRQGEMMYANLGRGIRAALDSARPEVGQVQGAPVSEISPAAEDSPSPPQTPSLTGTPSLTETQNPAQSPTPSETVTEEASAKDRRIKKSGVKPQRETEIVPGQSVPSKRRLKVRIAEMYARGLAPQEIASQLNLSLTEVDLALNLLQRPNN